MAEPLQQQHFSHAGPQPGSHSASVSTAGPTPPRGSEFHNIEPRTREERVAGTSKELLEKSRIRSRYMGPHKPPPPPSNPLVPVKESPMYIDEYDRFTRDAAKLEQQQKLAQLSKKETVYQRKREESYYREAQKWQREEATFNKLEKKYDAIRGQGLGGVKRNSSSEQYNIVTLDYANTPGGQALKGKDEATRYKAELRSLNLYSKAHSVTHNIITGEPLRAPQIRPPPAGQPSLVAPWDK